MNNLPLSIALDADDSARHPLQRQISVEVLIGICEIVEANRDQADPQEDTHGHPANQR